MAQYLGVEDSDFLYDEFVDSLRRHRNTIFGVSTEPHYVCRRLLLDDFTKKVPIFHFIRDYYGDRLGAKVSAAVLQTYGLLERQDLDERDARAFEKVVELLRFLPEPRMAREINW